MTSRTSLSILVTSPLISSCLRSSLDCSSGAGPLCRPRSGQVWRHLTALLPPPPSTPIQSRGRRKSCLMHFPPSFLACILIDSHVGCGKLFLCGHFDNSREQIDLVKPCTGRGQWSSTQQCKLSGASRLISISLWSYFRLSFGFWCWISC